MSTIRTETLVNLDGSSPADLTGHQTAKAVWDYYQVPPTIRYSANVTSITDTSAGEHTVTYTNSFSNSTVPVMQSVVSSAGSVIYNGNIASTIFVKTYDSANTLTDTYSGGAGYGDLA